MRNDFVRQLPTTKENPDYLKQCGQVFKTSPYSMGTGGSFPGDKVTGD
jgi:hypothetical protein